MVILYMISNLYHYDDNYVAFTVIIVLSLDGLPSAKKKTKRCVNSV